MRLCRINLLYFLGFLVVAFAGELILYYNMLSSEDKRFLAREVGLGISIVLGTGLAICIAVLITCAISYVGSRQWMHAIIRIALALVIVVLFRYAFFTFLVYAHLRGNY